MSASSRGRGAAMLEWALIFLPIAIVAGVLGFTHIAAGAAGIAKVLFFIAIAIFGVMIVAGPSSGTIVL